MTVKPLRERKGKSRRQLRMEEQVRRILGDMLRSGANDPRIGFASVQRVEVAGDLKSAKVYVSVLGEAAEVSRTLEGLKSARGYFQRELGKQMSSRYTPVITFSLDPAIEIDARIDRLLEAARERGEEDAGSPGPGPALA
jgi:ribosome-binding factor A